MEKLLTVSVAAYNGTATLQKALESCLVADESLQALLDVIIIDDGSTDGTAALAQAFVQAHPGSFRLVSKVNGGYGSTLNTAVELASGRYFRTLDCDDWFDTNALQTLLRRLQNCTADAVYTNYRTVQENGNGKAFDVCCKFDTNRVYAVGEVQQATPDLCMEMHALTLCTKTLRAAWRPMPEHCSYTDMGYTFVGMAAAQTICFVPVVLYQYRLGRDGQSVSMASYRAHTQDYIRVARILLDAAEPLAAQPAPAGRDLLLVQRARDVAQYLIELYLRFLSEVFNIPMLKGRFINDGDLADNGDWRASWTKAVINEEAARIMGIDNPIGKKISIWNYTIMQDGSRGRAEMEIVGIIQNFQAASLRNPILPQVIVIDQSKWNSYFYYARTEPGKEKATIKAIRNIFKKHSKSGDPTTCNVQTISQILDRLSTSEDASLQLFTLLALFCTLISIFGLYSISSSNMEQRRKEIAIRKVMGASAGTIVKMFFMEYLTIALIANLLALPLAWLFMQSWLQQYAYRSHISAWMYIVIVFATITLIIGTVLYQTIQAARTNPAEVIKSE